MLLFPLVRGGSGTKIIIKCCLMVRLFVLLRKASSGLSLHVPDHHGWPRISILNATTGSLVMCSTLHLKGLSGETEVSSGYVEVATFGTKKVQLHSCIIRSSAIHLLPKKHPLPAWRENSGCPFLWHDYRHHRPPLKHNTDTFKCYFSPRISPTTTCCSATQFNISEQLREQISLI